jgi:tripartite-type tricarboxylate transporter receptor subunit TctC
MNRRHASIAGLVALATALLMPQLACAQNYPSRPIRLILPFVMARQLLRRRSQRRTR